MSVVRVYSWKVSNARGGRGTTDGVSVDEGRAKQALAAALEGERAGVRGTLRPARLVAYPTNHGYDYGAVIAEAVATGSGVRWL